MPVETFGIAMGTSVVGWIYSESAGTIEDGRELPWVKGNFKVAVDFLLPNGSIHVSKKPSKVDGNPSRTLW